MFLYDNEFDKKDYMFLEIFNGEILNKRLIFIIKMMKKNQNYLNQEVKIILLQIYLY